MLGRRCHQPRHSEAAGKPRQGNASGAPEQAEDSQTGIGVSFAAPGMNAGRHFPVPRRNGGGRSTAPACEMLGRQRPSGLEGAGLDLPLRSNGSMVEGQEPGRAGRAPRGGGGLVVTPRRAIVVRCLRCRHEGSLSEQSLIRFGLKQDAPISAFVKRLRCSKCGSGDGTSAVAFQPGRPQASSLMATK